MFKQHRYKSVFLSVIFLLQTAFAFAGGPENRYNLLVVVVNCLNKFHVPVYGYPKDITPNLDLFARDAYIFKNLVCPVSHTPPVIRELFRATPSNRKFYAQTDWSDQDIPKLTDYPIGQFLVAQKYVYFHEKLPDNANQPFVSFMHFWNLHFPYDLFRRRENRLPAAQRRIYKSRLSSIDEITLVKEPADTEKFPGFMDYQIFGVRRTQVPIQDAKVWAGLLENLKESGDSPSAMIAAGLPATLKRRLAQIRTADQLTLPDKRAIVSALNGFIRDPDSPIGKILFGPKTVYSSEGLSLGDAKFNRWDYSFVTDIEKHLFWPHPDPILHLGKDGRLGLMKPLNSHQRTLLRQIYREALELVLPALVNHPQHLWVALDPTEAKAWQNSPNYENELALFQSLYDANVTDVDQRFAQSLERLSQLGVLENTVVVFMGDHGEALMEHGKMEHGHTCYNEDINPPLLIRVPRRLTKSALIETQLRTADVLPTVLDLMGLRAPFPPNNLAGVNFAPNLDNGSTPGITAFSRSYSASRSIRREDGWKLIWEMGTNQRELYNWKTDPKEIHNVAADFPKVTVELEEEMNSFLYGD